ncbi:TlpA family protein disulfide reductase [Azospirillum sp. ST 5-10]|uniref:TlpA family protein disulfide reductase n=1 Tax=unclassified Azospirillum TaxID=2630922 RepID=UPI003F49E8E8
MTRWAFLLLALLPALAGCGKPPVAEAGAPAPELTVLDRDGNAVRLADFRGRVVLVNFWITGCGPCLAEMPGLDRVYRARRERGFAVLGVNMGQDPDTVEAARRRLRVSFPLLSDQLMIAAKTYAVVGVPVSFLVDAEGRLRERIDGLLEPDALERKLDALM